MTSTSVDLGKSGGIERGIPLYEQIQNALWEKIISGEIAPGQHMSDRQWADDLNVSRTPVREAMRQMARDKVLLTLEGGGYRVRNVDRAGLRDLYICRSVLAAAAVRETTSRGDKALLNRIRKAINNNKGHIKRYEAESIFVSSSKFHDLIIEGSNNEYLIDMMHSIQKMILFYRANLLRGAIKTPAVRDLYFNHLYDSYDRHLKIVTEMEKGDANSAAKLMQEHLLETARDMENIFLSIDSAEEHEIDAGESY